MVCFGCLMCFSQTSRLDKMCHYVISNHCERYGKVESGNKEGCNTSNRAASDVIYLTGYAFSGGLAVVCSPQTHMIGLCS